MSGKTFKVGQRVEVTGKDVKGVIAYIGVTEFAPGSWIGLVLDDAKGKNNGTIQGTSYFSVSPLMCCDENIPPNGHPFPVREELWNVCQTQSSASTGRGGQSN